MSAARHVGTSESCPACVLLPEDQFARREAVWLHALARFADSSGVDVTGMTGDDLAPLMRAWSRADTLARMDRRLLLADPPPAQRRFRYEPTSHRVALFLMLAITVCLGIICSGVWRFFT